MSQLLETALRDIRYAFRAFRRRPLSALTAILTLALAIGANSAIFSMISAVLLRPLPWPDPDRLVILWETNQKQGASRVNPSSANFFDWRERSHSFQTLAQWRFVYFNLSGNDRFAPERVQGARVGVTFLPLLGAQGRGNPAAGVPLASHEPRSGCVHAVCLRPRPLEPRRSFPERIRPLAKGSIARCG